MIEYKLRTATDAIWQCGTCAALVIDTDTHTDFHEKCCGGGPQWGHAMDCPTLP